MYFVFGVSFGGLRNLDSLGSWIWFLSGRFERIRTGCLFPPVNLGCLSCLGYVITVCSDLLDSLSFRPSVF